MFLKPSPLLTLVAATLLCGVGIYTQAQTGLTSASLVSRLMVRNTTVTSSFLLQRLVAPTSPCRLP